MKAQVDTPRKGSWAEEQETSRINLHGALMHVTHQEEQRLINTMRLYPLARVINQEYAESLP